ncbi:copper chaperone PCu(A)C [Vibrio tritonius]|uniref:Copper chaperone PCu(A)C n=1 Tax=Vibrio tritonius TaxID=1435069 RepID=A0ABS7YSW9_9VIBR|nr:copper chaperone PCu(A)C [Vibrio tritonius]MCA2018731.1 copper chaperone PCu(A)C [Vibrio tritonius]
MRSVLYRLVIMLVMMVAPNVVLAQSIHVEVGQAEIFMPQNGASATGSKMTIYNRTDKPLIITKVVGKLFKHTMLHETVFEGGQRVMRPIAELTVKPHQQLVLTPNTAHIMLMGLIRPLKRGELVPLTLVTNQGPVNAIARVVPMHLH